MGPVVNENYKNEQDRLEILKKRIIQLKGETQDILFSEYLDRTWNEVQMAENTVGQLERMLEQNYLLYQRKQAAQSQPQVQMQQPYVQPQPQAQMQQSYVQPQVQMQQPYVQPQPQVQVQQSYVQPQPQVQKMQQPYVQPQPQVQMQQPYMQPQSQVQMQQSYVPPQQQMPQPQKSMEFKVGTVLLGIVGIAFLLVAFITFGLNYMNDVLQGVFLYAAGIVILLSSELFFAKRVEKFSYCLTGLGISSIYITTLLNYLYLKVLPGWAALLITVVVTAFFFYLSRKKDSGMIRIICLIGCYISLIPMNDLKGLVDFALPAIVIFFVNLAGIYCPIKKRRKAVDVIQYLCSYILIFYLIHLQYLSGMEMWPVYILVCTVVLTLSLLYLHTQDAFGKTLYFIGQAVNLGCLIYIGYHEYWLHFGVIGVLLLCAALTAVLWKTNLRFASYLFLAIYTIFAYMWEGDAFWLTFACLMVFVINKCCVRFFREFPIPDAVYTMLSAIGVCCLARNGDVQVLGYIYAFAILLSCIFVRRYKQYHIYTSLSFGFLFLLTEDCRPFLSSILICVLAAAAIGAGFYKKDKGIRIYGLVLMIFVALKLVIYDFYASQAGIRVLVFLVVGLLILGISFLYIYLEKKLNEEEKRRQEAQMPIMEQGMVSTELNL
jgi:hypothetical protein